MRLIENTSVNTDGKGRVYCQEEYAQELYDMMFGDKAPTGPPKDFRLGDIIKGHITRITEDYLEVDNGAITLYLDRERETRFLHQQGVEHVEPGIFIEVMVINPKASLASAEAAFAQNLKEELHRSLKENKTAYQVTVAGVNDGGFLVSLNGLECFMPGSLAAANKVTDFESMMGKELYVMVENYLKKSDMFVVSAKKYIKHILPSKIKELDYTEEVTGHVTGVAKYGVFVEWDEIFTGLLHETEASPGWQDMQNGEEIKFFVKEVRKGNRLILSQKGPSEEVLAFEQFAEEFKGKTANGEVQEVKPFGIFIKFNENVTGLLPPREFRKFRLLAPGDWVDVHVKDVDVSARRVYLTQPMEDKLDALRRSFN